MQIWPTWLPSMVACKPGLIWTRLDLSENHEKSLRCQICNLRFCGQRRERGRSLWTIAGIFCFISVYLLMVLIFRTYLRNLYEKEAPWFPLASNILLPGILNNIFFLGCAHTTQNADFILNVSSLVDVSWRTWAMLLSFSQVFAFHFQLKADEWHGSDFRVDLEVELSFCKPTTRVFWPMKLFFLFNVGHAWIWWPRARRLDEIYRVELQG
jgi:hypothetical protein